MGSGSSRPTQADYGNGNRLLLTTRSQGIGAILNYADDIKSLDHILHKDSVGAVQVQRKEGKSRNASEALLSEVMRKVEREEIELRRTIGDNLLVQLHNDLKEILHILRDKRLKEEEEEEESKLNYDICDAVELAQDIMDFYKQEEIDFSYDATPILRCVGAVKTRMLLSTRRENVGEDEDEDGDHMVGMENQMDSLVPGVIFYEKPALFTLTIDGMAGIGKTALVRKLYNHAEVVDKFERRAWVRVSSHFTHKEVLMKLIQQVVLDSDLLLENMMHADIGTLQRMLHQQLVGMRYLIVLDDVPEEMHMYMILKGLPHEEKGSRLMLTSRFENKRARATARHEMKPLNSNQSWELFMNEIFGGNKFTREHEFPKLLEREAKEMLSNCGGVPSAIKNVGMQVAKMRESGIEWEQLLESIDFDGIFDLFEESYQKLDPKTKSCFMYLACFKENITIRIEMLDHILEAGVGDFEGEEPTLHTIELIEQSFIQLKEYTFSGLIKTCGINVMLHRLSMKKAEEEIGFEILSNNGNTRRPQRPCHRVIKCSRDKFDYSTDQDRHLVSLFFHGGGGYLDPRVSFNLKSLNNLKILHLEDFGLKILPEAIGFLTKLRYLGLRNNYIRALPRSLRRLEELEVLDIAQNFMVEVPNIIWDMNNLLHLYMNNVICPKPLRIDAQWSLLTLTYITLDNWICVISGSEEATGLKKLGIEGLDENSDIRKLFASLAKLRCLYRLILKGFRFKRMPYLDELGNLECVARIKLDGFLARLPRSFPLNMNELKLVNACLDEDPMPVLGKMRCLSHLNLQNAYTGQEMEILDDAFPNLQLLCIEDLWHLRNLRVGKDGVAKLKQLHIKHCPCLESLPGEIGSMTELQELKMVTTKSIEMKIRKLGFISKIFNLVFHTY